MAELPVCPKSGYEVLNGYCRCDYKPVAGHTKPGYGIGPWIKAVQDQSDRYAAELRTLRAAAKEVLDACDAVSATFGEGEEEMTVYADAMAHLRKVVG